MTGASWAQPSDSRGRAHQGDDNSRLFCSILQHP